MVVGVERHPRSHCPISLALEAIGDKWSLLILRDLIVRGKSRYQDLLNSEERIATNILAERLLRLGQQGLISKAGDRDDKRKFRYAPTQKALDLLPVIFEMARWTAKYDPYTDPTNPLLQRMKASKEGFMKEIAAQCPAGRGSARQHPLLRGKQRPTAQGPRRERKHP